MSTIEEAPPGFNYRLVTITIVLVGIAFYKDILKFFHPNSADEVETIPMYMELNNAFDNLKPCETYNSDLFYKIHNVVKKIVDIKLNNSDISQQSLIELQIELRKYIDNMKLYIPADADLQSLWDTNVKTIIDTTMRIIKEILTTII